LYPAGTYSKLKFNLSALSSGISPSVAGVTYHTF